MVKEAFHEDRNSASHDTPSDLEELWQNWQIELTILSTNSVQETVDGAFQANHFIKGSFNEPYHI